MGGAGVQRQEVLLVARAAGAAEGRALDAGDGLGHRGGSRQVEDGKTFLRERGARVEWLGPGQDRDGAFGVRLDGQGEGGEAVDGWGEGERD
jgi:hypothetical protein